MITLPPDPALEEFRETVSGIDDDIDLARASLLVACTEYPDLEIEPIIEGFDALAARVVARMDGETNPLAQVAILNRVTFSEAGLKGASESYYDPRNSFLNDVMERQVGIPISLSIVYMAIGERAGIALGGTAMPMHFLVRVLGVNPPVFVDCYNEGRLITRDDCREAVRRMTRGQLKFREEMIEIISNGAVITRLLTNLKMIYANALQYTKMLPILDRLLILNPGETSLLRERGLVRYKLGQGPLARQDLQRYLESAIEPADAEEIRKLLKRIV